MGVKELWSILSPAKKEVSLDTLKGHIIAVDLSVWICENQGVKAVQGKVSKPHLRNLFFRISNLIQLGITLVFVVDGDPPELKWETISSRINSRYRGRGRGSTKNNKQEKPGRSHFKRQIKECLELLDSLGVPYVQSTGEAEALCALLNQEGIVDGCITEDGDVFLYGATTVYKNFNLAGKNPVIDCYKMADIESQLGLTRETLIALALLLGCDYVPKGVPGVGKVHAIQLVSQFRGSNVLQRFKRWADRDVEFQLSLPSKPAHCTRCHHIGPAQKHKTEGCPLCGMSSSCTSVKNGPPCVCDWHRRKQEFDKCGPERDIMLKAMQVPGFPQENVINEFLNIKDKCPKHPLKFERPKMTNIMKFALDKLDWPEKYTREKVIDLVVFHDLQNSKEAKQCTENLEVATVVKRRIRNGVPCVEVLWKLPDAWKLEEDESDVISTIENFDLFKSIFPEVVEEFESIEASKKENKKGKKKKRAIAPSEVTASGDRDVVETVTDQLSGLMLQTNDTKDYDDGSSLSLHTDDKLSGDWSCDSSHSPKRMHEHSVKEEFCLHKEKIKDVTCSSSLLCSSSSSQQDHALLDNKMFKCQEREETLKSAERANVVQIRKDGFAHLSNSGYNHLSARDEEGEQCSILDSISEHDDDIPDRMYQSLDDSIIPSLAERLDLKRGQTVCGGTDRDCLERRKEFSKAQPIKKLGSKLDETGGSSGKVGGKKAVDVNMYKDQGKYEKVGYMEQRNGHAEKLNHIDKELVQKMNLEQEGKTLKQRLENVKQRNLSRVVSGACISYSSGLTSTSTTLCPELFDISTPDLSLVDGASISTITQSSINQRKIAKNGQEISSLCPEHHDISTPNVTLLEKGEMSSKRCSQENRVVDSSKGARNPEVFEEIYDLCTPDTSVAYSNDERQELGDIFLVRPTGETEKGGSPFCSGSCNVIRAAQLALHVNTKGNLDHDGDLKFGQEDGVPLEPIELYDLCTPDVYTVVNLERDEVTCEDDDVQDVIEISDDNDDIYQEDVNSCIQDCCNELDELHLSEGNTYEGDGRSKEGGGQVRSTPECSLWEEPTALNINTPSQTMVRGTPSTNEREESTNRERKTLKNYDPHQLQDSCQIGSQYSSLQLTGTSGSETFTGEEMCTSILEGSGGLSPSTVLHGSTLLEKSMDHSLFQNLNFSLGTSEWTFSPQTERSGTGECRQMNQGTYNVEADKKHLNNSNYQSRKVETFAVNKHVKSCINSVLIDERLEWQIGGNVMTKSRTKESNTHLKEVEGGGGKILDKTGKKEGEGSLKKLVDKQPLAGYEQVLMDQPVAVQLMCNERGKKILSDSANITSTERRCEVMMGRGEGNVRGLSLYKENHREVLMESSNHGKKNINTKREGEEIQQKRDGIGKDCGQSVLGKQSLTNQESTKEWISQSCTMISDTKIQRNCNNYGRERDTCADKENSPVSLMDRLRKKSARTRDILESMELD